MEIPCLTVCLSYYTQHLPDEFHPLPLPPLLPPLPLLHLILVRRWGWEWICAEGSGRHGDELLCQILDLCVWRDVHHGLLCWKTCWIQDHLHAAVPALPLSVSGRMSLDVSSDAFRNRPLTSKQCFGGTSVF